MLGLQLTDPWFTGEVFTFQCAQLRPSLAFQALLRPLLPAHPLPACGPCTSSMQPLQFPLPILLFLSFMQALLCNLLDPVKNEEMWSSLFKNSLEFHNGNSKALSQV